MFNSWVAAGIENLTQLGVEFPAVEHALDTHFDHELDCRFET